MVTRRRRAYVCADVCGADDAMMSIFKNAVESIQIGVEDFNHND